jgi:hypothetical protein
MVAIGLVLALPAFAQDAKQIMERTRMGAKLQHNDLQGKLTKRGMPDCPVYLFLRGENIQFWCDVPQGGKWERKSFHLRMGDDKPELFENMGGKQRRFARDKIAQPIAGSDLTYEDLSMRFLYWPNPSIEAEEKVGLFDCWKIRVDNPGNDGAYRTVYVWVSKKHGAFVKVQGFDRRGNIVKEFKVEDVMKLKDGSYTLRKMEVASYANKRVSGRSELTFESPTRPSLKGPR